MLWTLVMIVVGLGAIYLAIQFGFYLIYAAISMLVKVRKFVVEYSYDHNLSPNPWFLLIWETLWIREWMGQSKLLYKFGQTPVIGFLIQNEFWHGALLCVLIALPLVILILKAGFRLLPLLLIKAICVPLDLVYLIYSFFDSDDEFKPVKKQERMESGSFKTRPARITIRGGTC